MERINSYNQLSDGDQFFTIDENYHQNGFEMTLFVYHGHKTLCPLRVITRYGACKSDNLPESSFEKYEFYRYEDTSYVRDFIRKGYIDHLKKKISELENKMGQ